MIHICRVLYYTLHNTVAKHGRGADLLFNCVSAWSNIGTDESAS